MNGCLPVLRGRLLQWLLALGAVSVVITESALGAQAPSLVLDSGTLAFTEGDGATTISPGATAADVDGDWNGGTLTVQITANASLLDYLTIGTALGISVSLSDVIESGVTFGTLNLAGGGGQVSGGTAMVITFNGSATDARVQQLVRSLTFNAATNAPETSTRTITFTLVDAAATSVAATRAVSVAAVNDAPSITDPGSITTSEDVATALTGISFTDADADSASLTATFAIGTGSLTATSGGGVTVSGSGGTTLTLNGSLTDLNSFLSASNVVFLTATNAYTNVFLTVTINDNGNTGGGGALSATNSVVLTVTPVNDFPFVTTSGGSAAFVEGNNVPSTPVLVDDNLVVSNPDTATLSAALVAISQQYVSGEDALGFANNALTMGNITGSFDSAFGYIQLTSAGATATVAQWETALRSITYLNSSEAPSTATRTITFIVYDGAEVSSPATRTLTVTATNDTPQIMNLETNSVTFTEDGPAVALDALGDALVADVDFTTFNGGYLQVAISVGLVSAQDVLAFRTNGGVALSAGMTAGSTVSVNGTNVGTLISSGAAGENLIVHWNSATTTNAAEVLLRSLVYTNLSDSPTTNARSVQVEIADGVNGLGVATVSLAVVASDDVPTVTMSSGAAAFVEGADVASTPVVVDGGLVVADPDDADFVSATIAVTGNLATSEDVLAFQNNGVTMGDIAGSYLSGSHALQLVSLGGSATKAQFQAALRSVTYLNLSDAPSTNTRAISVHVQSGPQVSAVAMRDVTIAAANDSPQFANLDGDAVLFTEAGPGVALDNGGDALVIDPDAEPFALGMLEFGITNNVSTNDTLFLDLSGAVQLPFGLTNEAPVAVSGITIGWLTTTGTNGMHLIIGLNSNATPALVQTLVRAVSYTNSSAAPSTATRGIFARLYDSANFSASVGLSVGISEVNTAPTISPPADFGITEQEYFDIPAFTVADEDAGTNDLLVTLELSSGGLSTTVLPFPGVVATGTNGVSRLVGTAAAINGFLAGETNFLGLVWDDDTTNITLTIGVSDGGYSGTGGVRTNHAVVQLTLTTVNDEPTMIGWEGGTIPYLEGDSPVFLDIGTNGIVTDSDSADFAGGFLSVGFIPAVQPAEDVLAFSTNGVVSLSAALTMGTVVSVSNVAIGTVAGSGSSGEALRVDLNSNATPARVELLVQRVTYHNSSESPNETQRSVVFDLSDGDGGTNRTGVYVTVTDVNDPPSFELTIGYGQTNSAYVVAWGTATSGETNLPPNLSDVAAISAGDEHALALRTDGTVAAWGLNDYGQTDVPAGLTNVVAVSAGTYHSLALLSNGTVVAWGRNASGETNVPAGLTNVVAVAAGLQQSAAVRADGTLALWGLTNWPPANLTGVRDIEFGGNHGVVLFTDGTVATYGANFLGQLNQPSGLAGVRAIAAGYYHSVVVHSNGTVSAWGNNGNGQSSPPSDLTNVVGVAATGFAGLALRDDGTLAHWGHSALDPSALGLTGVLDVNGGGFYALARVANILQPITVAEDSGPFTLVGVATNIVAGPAGESSQSVTFHVLAAETHLFSVQPAIDAAGTLTFTPAPNAYGSTPVSVEAVDDGGTANGGVDRSAGQTFIIEIVSVEDEPLATDDAYSVAEGGTLSVSAISGVLANDVDGDVEPLRATLVTDVSEGVLVLGWDGTFIYIPQADFSGTDSFQYRATNYFGTSAVATVTLTVTPVNDPPEAYANAIGGYPGSVQGLFQVAVLDLDAGTNLVSVEVSSPVAALTAIQYGPVTVLTNALEPRLVRVMGSVSNLANYLGAGGVALHAPDDVMTNFTYTVTVDDHGHTGADPGLSGTATNEIASVTAPFWLSPITRRVVPPGPGTYRAGDTLDFTVQASRPLLVNTSNGTPAITLTLFSGSRTASYLSGSGTTNLLFRYVVQSGDWGTNLSVQSPIEFNAATITDLESNGYAGSFTAPAMDGVIVDAQEPGLLGLFPIAPAWYPLGAVVSFTVIFTEDMIVDTNGGVPRLALTLGNTNAHATYVAGSGGNLLTFQYTVREGDLATNGLVVSSNIVLNGGTLRDVAGNDAALDFGGDLALTEVRVDGVLPEFDYAIHFTPTLAFNIASDIHFVAYVSEPVTVDTNFGPIQIEYQFDFGPAYGNYVSNETSGARLHFVHTVQPGDQATNGFAWSTNLIFNSLAIRDVAGNSARPVLPPPYRYENIIVDSLVPAITNAILPPDGIYTSSEPMDFVFEYTESVTNLGAPRFALTVGGVTRYLSYHSGSGSNALVFRYTPQPGDFDTDGIALVGALDLNGGAIRDLAGNDAEPVDIGETDFPALRVDASPPIAQSDSYSLPEDRGATGFFVLENDSDADDNPLTLMLISSATNGTVLPGPDNTFVYTPAENFAGIDGFTYVISDGLLTSAVASVTIEILAINDPPTITGPTGITVTNGISRPLLGVSVADLESGTNPVQVTFFSGDLGSVFLLTNRSGVTVSNGGSGVSFHLSGTVSNLNAYLAATNVFYVADTNRATHHPIAVYVHDGGHDGADPGIDGDPDGESAMIQIFVDNIAVNEPPVVNLALTNQPATYGTAFSFTFPTNTFIDPDGDTLSYAASGLPPGVTFTGATRSFGGTPTSAGSYTVRVIAGDGGTPELRVTNSFTVTVAKAPLTITADDQARPCGTPNPAFTLSFAGFRGLDTRTVLDTLPVARTDANAVSGPGVYAITLTGGSDDNYEFTLVGGTLVITNGVSGSGTVRGTYHGLFYETNAVRHESSGAFLIKATDAGAYSGTLELAGTKLRLSGAFPSGRAVTNVIARKNLSSLTVVLGFDDCDPPQAIFGTVSDGTWTAPLMATPLHFHAKTNPAPTAGRYAMTIPGFEGDPTLPAGHGWGTVTISTAGKLKLAGALADGTKLTDGSFVNEAGFWPFYLPYARNGGAMLGWITFDSGSDTNFSGVLSWIRKTQPVSANFYAAGFTNETLAIGSRYLAPGRSTNVFTWTNGIALAEGGNLSGVLSNGFNLGSASRVTWLGTNFTALTFTPKDGRFKGTLRHNGTGKPATFNGVIHPAFSVGAGYFLGTNQSGLISIEPAP